jgi:plasmid stability protein
MSSRNEIHISDELIEKLRTRAAASGKSIDEFAEEALTKGLDAPSWEEILEYGLETGRASGHAEEDVPQLVKEWRREQRRR